MRRPASLRLLAALLLGWLPFVLGDGLQVHGCATQSMAGAHALHASASVAHPEHAHHAASTTVAAASSAHAHEAASAPSAHAHGAHHAAPTASLPAEHDAPGSHDCDCIGQCCPSAIAAVALPETPSVSVRFVASVDAPTHPTHQRVAAWVDFVLPFATAPPALVTS